MPSTVAHLFEAAHVQAAGVVHWHEPVPEPSPGIYLVTLTDADDRVEGASSKCLIDVDMIHRWLAVRPELTLDGQRPSEEQLAARVAAFWPRDETILYIGLAGTSLRKRVRQYYRTPIGAQRPHAGGYFIKLLGNLDSLHVHFARCEDPDAAEDAMLFHFCAAISDKTKKQLHDPAHPFPFANLEWPRGIRKNHGIRRATGDLA